MHLSRGSTGEVEKTFVALQISTEGNFTTHRTTRAGVSITRARVSILKIIVLGTQIRMRVQSPELINRHIPHSSPLIEVDMASLFNAIPGRRSVFPFRSSERGLI